MRRIVRGWLVLGAVCVTLAVVAAVRSGPAHGDGSVTAVRAGTGRPTPPQAEQALAVARQEFGLLAGGGWAQAWDLWAPTAQQAVPQAEFVHVNTACRPPVGVPYAIDSSSVPDPATVRVTWHRAGTTGSSTLLYQAGRWRFVPDARTLAGHRLGADRLIRRRRAAGSCH